MPKCLVKSVNSVEQLFWGVEEWGWGVEAPNRLFMVTAQLRQELTQVHPRLLTDSAGVVWSKDGLTAVCRPSAVHCLLCTGT